VPSSANTPEYAIEAQNLRHVYGARLALDGVSFQVAPRRIFGLLGPNGGGKTTLFRILSTLLQPSAGTARVLGHSLSEPAEIRRRLGIVFQHPSVDGKLTVQENLACHGHLYGLSGSDLRRRSAEMLARLGLASRAGDRVGTLSGGLQRRTELAKALLHRPPLLLLDEPSSGLDPGARRDFMQLLQELRDRDGTSIVLTTHVMEEAERCDELAILHQGRLAGMGDPAQLKERVGGDVVAIQSPAPEDLAVRIRERFNCAPRMVDGGLRIERQRGHELVRDLVESFPEEITSVTYGKPTLEDVFIHLTGHRFWADGPPPASETV
jgi:ABC-2 type transport system ATP-binding protein